VTESRLTRILLRLGTVAVLAFIYVPLIVIALYAFNDDITQAWPIHNWTTRWFRAAWEDSDVRDAFLLSVKAAVLSSVVALVLGTAASLAVARYRFFGRDTISFLVILPIALPGIVTGIALNATIDTVLEPIGISFGLLTIVIGHATFCIVVIYNNVIARLRRVSATFEEASSDLGADSFTTFRRITLPSLRTALLAGGLLAFGLSFDEVIVTIFTAGSDQTLPIWIFTNLARPNQLPIINVVALVVIAISIIPVWLAQRLAGGGDDTAKRVAQIAGAG
jgi:putative spermidine/putrescine transport system permease protein